MNAHVTISKRLSEGKTVAEGNIPGEAEGAAAPRLNLGRDARRRLVLWGDDGEHATVVQPVRCFPISCDLSGRELLCVQDPDALEPAIRELLEEELARHEFVPMVQRIVRIDDDSECAEWQVETDRGPTAFYIDSDDAVRRLDGQRVMIIDSSGTRYLIENVASLDRNSHWLLDRYI